MTYPPELPIANGDRFPSQEEILKAIIAAGILANPKFHLENIGNFVMSKEVEKELKSLNRAVERIYLLSLPEPQPNNNFTPKEKFLSTIVLQGLLANPINRITCLGAPKLTEDIKEDLAIFGIAAMRVVQTIKDYENSSQL